MANRLYNRYEVAERVGVSTYTISNWYKVEKKMKNDVAGYVSKLPEPITDNTKCGQPKYWTEAQIKELMMFKKGMVFGRYGIYGKYNRKNRQNKHAE